MAENSEAEKTEAPTGKRLTDARRKGDVLQSRELATALIIIVGAGWLAFMGPIMVQACATMLTDGLSFNANDIRNFDPGMAALRLIAIIALPLVSLFGVTLLAAIGAPARSAARAEATTAGVYATSAGRSVIPQAWIMRTTTRATSSGKPARSASARMVANERR